MSFAYLVKFGIDIRFKYFTSKFNLMTSNYLISNNETWLKDWQMVQRIALSILNAEHEHEDCSEGRL